MSQLQTIYYQPSRVNAVYSLQDIAYCYAPSSSFRTLDYWFIQSFFRDCNSSTFGIFAHSTGTSLRTVNTKGKVFQIDDSPCVHGTDAGVDEYTAVPGGCRLKEDESQHPANSWTLKTLSRAGIFKKIFKAAAAVEEITQGGTAFYFFNYFFYFLKEHFMFNWEFYVADKHTDTEKPSASFERLHKQVISEIDCHVDIVYQTAVFVTSTYTSNAGITWSNQFHLYSSEQQITLPQGAWKFWVRITPPQKYL